MKTICILTFGTSDVQFTEEEVKKHGEIFEDEKNRKKITINQVALNIKSNRDYPGIFLLQNPREDGKILLENYDLFKGITQLPLTIPLIEKLQQENKKPEIFVLVYTDQTDDEKHRKSDTLFYAQIFKRKIIENFHYTNAQFIEYTITEKVTDYDFQYQKFNVAIKNKEIIPYDPEEIEKIYLLPQGGIDQINHTLTLQLIKNFGDRVEVYQAKESDQPKRIRFAELYLRDLIFDQIIVLINQGDYAGALALLNKLDGKEYLNLRSLLKFGDLKINALFNELSNIGKKAFDNQAVPPIVSETKNKAPRCKDQITEFFRDPQKPKNDYAFRVSEYFEIARFFNKPENRNRFVMAFAIFVESFLNHFNSLKTGFDLVTSQQKFSDESRKLIPEICNDNEIKSILENNFSEGFKNIRTLSVPVSLAIALKYSNQNELIILLCRTNGNFKDCICNLDDMRNNIAHRGKGISENDFSKISALFNEISEQFTDKPSSFEDLNKEIKNTIDIYRANLL